MSLQDYTSQVAERLMRYVAIDTTADPMSTTCPSSLKQKDLSKILVNELNSLGLYNVELDENGYVYATIPSTSDKKVPVVCLCSHVDTAPDCSGTDVKPILHKKWDGSDIVLPDDPSIVISSINHPYLLERIGDDIITASGKTLLGADDKAGIAIIMDTAAYLMAHPEVKHGEIRIVFTPDEEIGRGVDKINMAKVNANIGYTLDGGERGLLEGENFSANACSVTFHGISAHPGYAKGKLVNAQKVMAVFLAQFPMDSWSPETTSGYEGFVHPVSTTGELETATVKFIIRDFDTNQLPVHEARIRELAALAVSSFQGASFEMKVTEQYRNMKQVLDGVPQIMDFAEEAYRKSGLVPVRTNIRGGTDGARLTFMGMPCPNLFTGEMGIHSKQEYVSVQDMEKAVEVCVNLAMIWEEKGEK